MKENILCLKKERTERQVTEDKLVTAISELKHDTISMDFDREEKKIRVDKGDKELWGRSKRNKCWRWSRLLSKNVSTMFP